MSAQMIERGQWHNTNSLYLSVSFTYIFHNQTYLEQSHSLNWSMLPNSYARGPRRPVFLRQFWVWLD